jgi:hypothetical protein
LPNPSQGDTKTFGLQRRRRQARHRARLEQQLHRVADTAAQIRDPFAQSVFLLAHVAYLQGFIDDTRYDLQHLSNVIIGAMSITRHRLEQWLAGRQSPTNINSRQ